MIAERKRIAERYRSEGEGEAARIQGEKERELQRIQSEAYRTAQEIRGKADAAGGRDLRRGLRPLGRLRDFYAFLKSMETLESTIDADDHAPALDRRRALPLPEAGRRTLSPARHAVIGSTLRSVARRRVARGKQDGGRRGPPPGHGRIPIRLRARSSTRRSGSPLRSRPGRAGERRRRRRARRCRRSPPGRSPGS